MKKISKRDERGRFAAVGRRPVNRQNVKSNSTAKATATKRLRRKVSLNVSAHISDKETKMTQKMAIDSFRKIVGKNMTQFEIKALNKTGGVRIMIEKMGGDNEAAYHGIIFGKHCFTLDPEVFRNEETVTHEAIHALQPIDKNRPKQNRDLDCTNYDNLTLLEALTEAETIARVHTVNLERASYYIDIENECKAKGNNNCPTAATMKAADRDTLTDGKNKSQSQNAIAQTNKNFKKLHITKFKFEKAEKNAGQQFKRKR